MLKQVEIKNYRSCRHVILEELGPLTVLVGRNAAGKSNVLRAIRWLATTAAGGPREFEAATVETSVSCQARLVDETYHYFLEVRVISFKPAPGLAVELCESLRHAMGDGPETPVFERVGKEITVSDGSNPRSVSIGEFTPCMPALLSLLPADSGTARVIRPFLEFLEGIRYYDSGLEGGTDVSIAIPRAQYDEWLARYPGSMGDSPLMRLLHMELTNEGQLAEVRSLLGPDGLGLLDQIEWEKYDYAKPGGTTESRDQLYFIRFRPAAPSPRSLEALHFNDLAAGTQRLVRIVVSLVHDQSAVMLLEHPEDGIHRGLLRKLIDLLQGYSDQSQLIIASHSTVIFNTIDPTAIRLVTMGEDGTNVRSLTSDELRAAERFLEEEGSLSDFIESVEEA